MSGRWHVLRRGLTFGPAYCHGDEEPLVWANVLSDASSFLESKWLAAVRQDPKELKLSTCAFLYDAIVDAQDTDQRFRFISGKTSGTPYKRSAWN